MARNKVSLSDIVNNFLQIHNDSSYITNLKRSKVLLTAKRGIRRFSREVGGTLKSVAIKLESNLYVPYPADYMEYSKVGVVTDDGYIVIIKRNEEIPLAFAQLYSNVPDQDGNFPKLLDQDGIELLSSTPYSIPEFIQQGFADDVFHNYLLNNTVTNLYGTPTGNNVWGEFRPDDRNNRFVVTLNPNSDLQDVILEYVADETMIGETEEREPMIDQSLEELMYAFMYNEIVKYMPAVPAVEKQRSELDFRAAKQRARLMTRSRSLGDLLHALREGNIQSPKF